MARTRRLTKTEREYIKGVNRKGANPEEALTLYKRRLRKMIADTLASDLLRGEYEPVMLRLVDVYKCISRAHHDSISRYEKLQLLLEELLDLARGNATSTVLKQIVDEMGKTACKRLKLVEA